MKNIFKEGDSKIFVKTVSGSDTATFESGQVHPVYATFALARDAEWACRLFVLEMKEEDEEGIGTFINVSHLSPALIGSIVTFNSTITSLKGNELICSYEAVCDGRLIAEGRQVQKILKKEKLETLFHGLQKV